MCFWNRTVHVSDRFSVHHQEYSAVHTAIHTGYVDCLLANSQHNLYVLLCVQYYTPDDGQKTCPKHVEFYSENKLEKLVHLVGFIIRIYSFNCLCCIQMVLQRILSHLGTRNNNSYCLPLSLLQFV